MKTSLAHPVSLSTRRLTLACLAGALVSLVGLTLTDNIAHAASYSVTITTDGGAGSLRNAITLANTNPGPDTINLPAGTYTLTIAGENEDLNATGDLDITGATTIIGAGSGSTIIDAYGIDRGIEMFGGPVVLQSLTVTNGSAVGQSGGNVLANQYVDLTVADSVISNGTALYGGGIAADSGTTTILRSEIINNTVNFVPGNGAIGSAIAKGGAGNGTLIVTDSLIAGNNAIEGSGALYAASNATFSNSTFTGNTGLQYTVLFGSYGNAVNMTATLSHVTIAGNTTSGSAFGSGLAMNMVAPSTMTLTVEGSLIQNNLRMGAVSNCNVAASGAITSGGHNLSDDATCTSFTQPGDLNNNQSTTLGALANNGGPTRTLALVAGSSAIDAAGACGGVTLTDQRSVSRPQGPACDIGAFEVAVVVVPTTTVEPTTVAPTTNAPTTNAPTTNAPTTNAPDTTVATPSTVGSGGIGAATTQPPITYGDVVLHGDLPATGSSHSTSLWLATLVCSLGAMLVLTARRLVR